MTKEEIVNLYDSLTSCNNLSGKKFSYCLARNLNLLKNNVIKFEEERKLLLESFSEKDETGKPIIKDNKYNIKDLDSYNKEFNTLKEEKEEVNLFKISMEEIPENITVSQMSGIFPIIEVMETPV
jgi:hypothetical protein